jgi:hypothetical protein
MIAFPLLLQYSAVVDCLFRHTEGQGCAIKSVDANRAVAEFMSVCVESEFVWEEVATATQASDFHYTAIDPGWNGSKLSQRWHSDRTVVSFDPAIRTNGYGDRQCSLTVRVAQGWTSAQFLAVLKSKVRATFDLPVESVPYHPELAQNAFQWASEIRSYRKRITISADGKANQYVTLEVAEYSPAGNRAQHRRRSDLVIIEE